jgi:hypothetical protein
MTLAARITYCSDLRLPDVGLPSVGAKRGAENADTYRSGESGPRGEGVGLVGYCRALVVRFELELH